MENNAESPNILRIIRVSAEASKGDAPTDDLTSRPICFKQSDSLQIDIALLMNGTLVDLSQIESIELQLLDVGERNSPSPREGRLLVSKVIPASEINSQLTAEEYSQGGCHASVLLSSDDTALGLGCVCLRIMAYGVGGIKTTFLQGLVDVEPFFGAISGGNESQSSVVSDTEFFKSIFLSRERNLSDLSSDIVARENIGVYSKSESDSLYATKTEFSPISKLGLSAGREGTFALCNSRLLIPNSAVSQTMSVCVCVSGDSKGTFFSSSDIGVSLSSGNVVLSVGDVSDSFPATLSEVNAFTIVLDGLKVRVYLDSELLVCVEASFPLQSGCSFGSTTFTGTISRMKIFNFDISSESSPYGVSQYTLGYRPPVEILSESWSVSDGSLGAGIGDGWNFQSTLPSISVNGEWSAGRLVNYLRNRDCSSDSELPATVLSAIDIVSSDVFGSGLTSANIVHFFRNTKNFAKYLNRKIRVAYSFWYRNNNPSSLGTTSNRTAIQIGNAVVFDLYNWLGKTPTVDGHWKRFQGEKTITITAPSNPYLIITARSENLGDTAYVGSFADFKLGIVSASGDYEDCIGGFQIKDNSGNGNALTSEGFVSASKTANPSTHKTVYEWGASVVSGAYLFDGAFALPADCYAEIFAKSSSAASYSFGSSVSSSISYSPSVSVGTEFSRICGFCVGGNPSKLFVTPSLSGLKLEIVLVVNKLK